MILRIIKYLLESLGNDVLQTLLILNIVVAIYN